MGKKTFRPIQINRNKKNKQQKINRKIASDRQTRRREKSSICIHSKRIMIKILIRNTIYFSPWDDFNPGSNYVYKYICRLWCE